MKKIYLLFAFICFLNISLQAQENSTEAPIKDHKWTMSSGIEANILQFATVSAGGLSVTMINPRYSYFFNSGFDLNYKASQHVKLFSGIQVKNIGLIAKYSDSTKTKHRVYTLGAPLGVKINTRNKKFSVKAGADVAIALNYKWKHFVNGDKVIKGNEYFSNKTNLLFTSVFAGFSFRALSVSGNLYLNDFFNQSKVGVMGTNAKLFTISAGFNIDENTFKFKKVK